jgi:hypothetical protein
MNPTQYEWMANQHVDALRREAAGNQLLARARDGGASEQRPLGIRLAVRRLVDRVAGLRRRPGMDVPRPNRDSGVATPSLSNPR